MSALPPSPGGEIRRMIGEAAVAALDWMGVLPNQRLGIFLILVGAVIVLIYEVVLHRRGTGNRILYFLAAAGWITSFTGFVHLTIPSLTRAGAVITAALLGAILLPRRRR